jgi:hypothetical protein
VRCAARALSLPGVTHGGVRAAQRARVVVAVSGSVELFQHETALIGAAVARDRGPIAEVRARVTLIGDGQARAGCVVAIVGDLLPLVCRSRAGVMAELARAPVGTVGKVAGDLIAIGCGPVLVGARPITVRARLVYVWQRLHAVAERLPAVSERVLVRDRPGLGGGAFLLSIERPVDHGAIG